LLALVVLVAVLLYVVFLSEGERTPAATVTPAIVATLRRRQGE
jgi:hypothetical protein